MEREPCVKCGRPATRGKDHCSFCEQVDSSRNQPYDPDDAVEGGLYLRDPNHDTAVHINRGRWPKEWL